MKVDRRQALGMGAAGLAALALTGCDTIEQRLTRPELGDNPLPPPSAAGSPATHLLNRIAFGPRPGDVAEVERMGTAAYIDRQLAPDSIDEPDVLTWRVHALGDMLNADAGLLFDEDDRRLVLVLRQAALLRAVYSRRQLYERMVEFWSDHFNIYAFKAQGPQLKVIDDRDTIRAHAFGNFRDLLQASARSAAMLGYLDNVVNRAGVANENYAREVMELHTLGVNGGYTQHDVHELARCLTGWTSEKHWHRGRFLFDADAHDNGMKRILGLTIAPGGGVRDGERVLDLLAVHPSTAEHIATKLCRYFVGDAPKPLVTQVAAVFQQTHGDIKSVVRAVITSSEFESAQAILKRPFDYAVSALRALNADTDGGAGMQDHLERMGQPLFGWPMPNGYPTDARSWLGGLIPRWNFALALLGDGISGTHVDTASLAQAGRKTHVSPLDALAECIFGRLVDDPVVRGVQSRLPSSQALPEYAALLLMSPEFQWR